MGFGSYSATDRMALVGIAQMAYGGGMFEGTWGGKGHMGLLVAGGKERVFRFDTHGGSSSEAEAGTSADNLRSRLWVIANREGNGLEPDVKSEIRTKLGLDDNGNLIKPKTLLDRKIVAQVLTRIGGNELWTAAKTGYGKSVAKAGDDTAVNFDNRVGLDIDVESLNTTKARADQHLEAFLTYARKMNCSGDKYVKLEQTGSALKLVDAGRRDILRGAIDKGENDFVHRFFAQAILAHFDGKIPKSVRDVMTGFTGGHPLSAKRIGIILDAIDAADDVAGGRDEVRQLAKTLRQRGPTFTAPSWTRVADKLTALSEGLRAKEYDRSVQLGMLCNKVRDLGATLDAIRDKPATALRKGDGRKTLEKLVSDLEDITSELPDALVGKPGGEVDAVWEEAMALRTELSWFASEVALLPESGTDRPGGPAGLAQMKIADFLGRDPDRQAVRQVVRRVSDVQSVLADLEKADPAAQNDRLAVIGRARGEVEKLNQELQDARQKLPPRIASMLEAQSARALNLLDALRLAVSGDATNESKFVDELVRKAGGFGNLVRDVVDGKYDAESYRTLRSLGYEPWAIESEFSERSESYGKKLGSGMGNTVYDKTGGGVVGEGTRWVFKPDASAVEPPEQVQPGQVQPGQVQPGPNPKVFTYVQLMGCGNDVVANNLATGLAQDLLGVSVSVKTKLTAPKNPGDKPSILMEVAEGKSLRVAARLVRGDVLGDKTEFESPEGCHGVMEELGNLDWLDWLTGQGDRHFDNCNINVQGEGENLSVNVKAFDNDMSFPTRRTGLTTFACGRKEYDQLLAYVGGWERSLKDEGKIGGEVRLSDYLSVKMTGEGDGAQYAIRIGFDREGRPWPGHIADGLYAAMGVNNARKPSYIPRSMLKTLEGLKGPLAYWKRSQQLPKSFGVPELDRLMTTLTNEQFTAMMGRLDEMIAHADELKKQGLVLESRQSPGWKDNLKNIYGKMLDNAWSASQKLDDVDGTKRVRGRVIDSAAEFLSECVVGGLGFVVANGKLVEPYMDKPLFRRLVSSPDGQNLVDDILRREGVDGQRKAEVLGDLLRLFERLVGDAENPDGAVVDRIATMLSAYDTDNPVNDFLMARRGGGGQDVAAAVEERIRDWEDVYVRDSVKADCKRYDLDFNSLFGDVPIRSDYMRAVAAMLANPKCDLMSTYAFFRPIDWRDRFDFLGALLDRTKMSEPPRTGEKILAGIPDIVTSRFLDCISSVRYERKTTGPLTQALIARAVWKADVVFMQSYTDEYLNGLTMSEFRERLWGTGPAEEPTFGSVFVIVKNELSDTLKWVNDAIFAPLGEKINVVELAREICSSATVTPDDPNAQSTRSWNDVGRLIEELRQFVERFKEASADAKALSPVDKVNDIAYRRLLRRRFKAFVNDVVVQRKELTVEKIKAVIRKDEAKLDAYENLVTKLGVDRLYVNGIEDVFAREKIKGSFPVFAPYVEGFVKSFGNTLVKDAVGLFSEFAGKEVSPKAFAERFQDFMLKALSPLGRIISRALDSDPDMKLDNDAVVQLRVSLFEALLRFDEGRPGGGALRKAISGCLPVMAKISAMVRGNGLGNPQLADLLDALPQEEESDEFVQGYDTSFKTKFPEGTEPNVLQDVRTPSLSVLMEEIAMLCRNRYSRA